MALIVEVKINNEKLLTMAAERLTGEKKGLNPYRLKLYDANSNLIRESSVVHPYEDGAIKLVQRMANELYQYERLITKK